MTGYIRNDTTNNIANGNIINADDLDGEFDALQSAFDASTGHTHDGTAGNGAPITVLGPVQDVVVTAAVIRPKTDNTVDLGTSSLEFKNLYLDGTAQVDTLQVDESATITANLTVNGNTTLGNAATDTVTVTADVASHLIPATDNTYDLGASTDEWRDLYIDGTANIDSLVADTADINGGTIDNATIATSNITVGSGKTLDVSAGTLTLANDQISGNSVEGGTINAITITTLASTTGNITTVNATTVDTTNIEVTNIKAKDGTASATIADSTGVMTIASSVLTTADINGGTIDGTTIGATTPAVGTFTTANATTVDTTNIEVTTLKAKDGTAAGSIADATGVVTLASSVLTTTDINGGTIDGTVIGGTTAAAGSFTTVSASGNITVGGTVDGRDVATDGTKLDGIEAGADVTDTANVTAAGALMDSELANIAAVKALNQGVATTDSPSFVAISLNGVAVTSSAAELNLLDGVTATTAEINFIDGVTSAIQTQLDAKVARTSSTGSAVVPAGTEAQRDGSPSAGFFRFNSDVGKFEGYNGSAWGSVGGGATGGGSDAVFIENDQTVTTNYTITAGRNAMTTGPITINSGITVTVPSGSNWVVL